MDQGITFQREGHGVESLASILYWVCRVEEQNLQNFIGPHASRVKTGTAPAKGLHLQEAEEHSIALWYNKVQEQVLRSNDLGEWKKAEATCDRVVKRSRRPNRPETKEVIACFYFMKISAQKNIRDSREETNGFFESLINDDRGPIKDIVLKTIEERDKNDFKFIANRVAENFEDVMREHISTGRLVIEAQTN